MNEGEHQDRLMEMLLAEELGGQTPPDLAGRIMAAAFPATPATKRRRLLSARWVGSVAAAILLVIGVGIWLVSSRSGYPKPRLAGDILVVGRGPVARGAEVSSTTGTGRLALGGYCSLEIAPYSRLRIEGAPRAEAVTLLDGQLDCDVQHAEGSFDVHTDVGTVHVTGTRFRASVADETDLSLQSRGEQPVVVRTLSIVVVSGTVLVSGAWGQTSLGAGQERIFTATTQTASQESMTGEITAVGDNTVTVARKDRTVTVAVTSQTLIGIRNGGKKAHGAFADLKVGMIVGIVLEIDGKTAKKIIVRKDSSEP